MIPASFIQSPRVWSLVFVSMLTLGRRCSFDLHCIGPFDVVITYTLDHSCLSFSPPAALIGAQVCHQNFQPFTMFLCISIVVVIQWFTYQVQFKNFCRPSVDERVLEFADVVVARGNVQELREQIRWVLFSKDTKYFNLFSATVCWIQKSPVSMCRVFPNPLLCMIPNAALASPQLSPFYCVAEILQQCNQSQRFCGNFKGGV